MSHAPHRPESYSDDSFWQKIGASFQLLGQEALRNLLVLYYCLKDPATPGWAKAVIVGALGYFISPIDLIPDFIPVVGYTDDIGVILSAMASIASSITDEHRQKASETIRRWSGL